MTVGRLILASSSPRRRELLTALGLTFETSDADVDESPLCDESAEDMVIRLAIAKAMAIAVDNDDVVLAADTAVAVAATIFGKPRDEAAAIDMLNRLSGTSHRVVTGVAVRHRGRVSTVLSSTEVRFRDLGPDEARRYWQTGEPRGKAGAYAIQGRGGAFVEAIMGSYTGVVGLPVFETAELLRRTGIDVLPSLRDRT